MTNIKNIVLKNAKLKTESKIKKVIKFLGETDIDFIFVFLASFIALKYTLLSRLFLSIGISYLYKKIVSDIIRIKIGR